MKVLLLAAGRGTRISRYLGNRPKCTVDIGNGQTLIEYTIDVLRSKGVSDIAVVTGYKHEVIEELLEGRGVKLYYSPFFDVTNSIVSAWFARDFIEGDDMIIMNADVFCEEELYDEMLSQADRAVMFYDTSRIDSADFRFFCEEGIIRKYGKELSDRETSGEYIGIARLRSDFLPGFKKKLEDMINTQHSGLWWENVLYSMAKGEGKHGIRAHDINPYFWAEVDYIEDYGRIIGHVRRGFKK